jgi:molybdenum-dependent DNA-binding transcriptional regulator ModE
MKLKRWELLQRAHAASVPVQKRRGTKQELVAALRKRLSKQLYRLREREGQAFFSTPEGRKLTLRALKRRRKSELLQMANKPASDDGFNKHHLIEIIQREALKSRLDKYQF